MADLTSDYGALRHDVGAVWLPRDALLVTGSDARSYLQGQLSQDIEALGDWSSAWSLILQPQGKVDALVRVTHTHDGNFVVDVDGGFGEAVLARLVRFKLRTKVDVEPIDGRCLAIRGPRAHEYPIPKDQGLTVNADWPGLPGVDVLGEAPAVPDGVPLCDLDAYEAVRIEAGMPRMGAELTDATIPAEAGIVDRAVSFTKGCYTGQELVARIDSRGGKVPRHLRGVVMGTNDIPPIGAAIERDGKQVGTVTSVGQSLQLRAPVALAYVHRDVDPPEDVTVRWDGGSAPARVETLPLIA